jgi:branched-chain amino acid transport system substrate-binding protein
MKRLLALACAFVLIGFPLGSSAADPYEINVILPQTGGAAFLGKEETVSLGVVEGVVNKSGGIRGRPIKFTFVDDQSSPQIAVQLLNQVIAKRVPIVLGSTLVALCSAMAPLVKNNGPVMYCFSPGIYPERGSYVFTASISVKDLLAATARYYRQKGYTKIAAITSIDASGQDGENNINAAFGGPEGAGMEIVDREHFNLTDISVAAQMSHIKASGANAMVAWVTGTALATILRGAADAGVDIPIVTSSGNLVYPQLDAYGSFIGDNVYFPGSPGDALDVIPRGALRDAVTTYINAMKAAGIRPDQGHTLAWDTALIVVEALRKLGTNATATQIRDYIMGIRGWSGINGRYDFVTYPQRGLGAGSGVMVRWEKSKGTWVSASALGGSPLK